MRHQNVRLTLSLLSVFAIVLFFGGQANAEPWSSSSYTRDGLTLSATLEFEHPVASTTEQYAGPQTAAALMAAFDAAYTEGHPKTTVTVSREGKRAEIKSEWTEAEIDARYPRAEWLQLLLDKGITITRLGDYAVYLSKRHTLALLEDNPKLWKSGILGLPQTKDWHTFKAAYLDKRVDFQAQIRASQASVEAAEQQLKRAQALIPAVPELPLTPAMPIHPAVPVPPQLLQDVAEIEQLIGKFNLQDVAEIEQLIGKFNELAQKVGTDISAVSDGQLKRANARVARAKKLLKRAEAQVERAMQQLKRAQEELERARKRTSPPSHQHEPK